MLTARRLGTALLLLVALTAAIAAPGQVLADYLDDYGDDGGSGGSGDGGGLVVPILGTYEVDVASSENLGMDVEEAYATVTPARGDRLRVRVSLRAAGFGGQAGSARLRAAPCGGTDESDLDLACRGGRTKTIALPAGAPQAITEELVIPAPHAASDAIRITASATTEADAVRLTLPSTAWRGPLAGQRVGVRTVRGDGRVGALAMSMKLYVHVDGVTSLTTAVVPEDRTTARTKVELTARRCAPLVPTCKLAADTLALAPGEWDDLEVLAEPRKPKGAAPVLTLRAVAHPSDAVVATANLPWPKRMKKERGAPITRG